MRCQKEEARAEIALAPLFQARCLLSTSGTGRTTIGGSAARSVGCVYRSCEAECDYGYQQNCSDALHDFLLFGMRVVVTRITRFYVSGYTYVSIRKWLSVGKG